MTNGENSKEGTPIPVFDFICEKCGFEHLDKYISSGEMEKPLFCDRREGFKGKVVVTKGEGAEKRSKSKKGKLCRGKLVRQIGAPAPAVMKVGRCGDPRSKREASISNRKRLLKRSYEHEFKRGGKGVEQRQARIEQLRKQGVPLPNVKGFG